MSTGTPRWAVVDGVVVEHRSFGLIVRLSNGEVGVVDRVMISDGPLPSTGWPPVGASVTVVGAGYTSGGQLRLSLRPSHLAEARQRAGGQ